MNFLNMRDNSTFLHGSDQRLRGTELFDGIDRTKCSQHKQAILEALAKAKVLNASNEMHVESYFVDPEATYWSSKFAMNATSHLAGSLLRTAPFSELAGLAPENFRCKLLELSLRERGGEAGIDLETSLAESFYALRLAEKEYGKGYPHSFVHDTRDAER